MADAANLYVWLVISPVFAPNASLVLLFPFVLLCTCLIPRLLLLVIA